MLARMCRLIDRARRDDPAALDELWTQVHSLRQLLAHNLLSMEAWTPVEASRS